MGKITKNLLISGNGLVIIYFIMKAIAKKNVESSSIDDNNPHVNHSITRNSDGRVLDGRFRATFSSDTQTSIVDTSKSRNETEEERVDKPDNTWPTRLSWVLCSTGPSLSSARRASMGFRSPPTRCFPPLRPLSSLSSPGPSETAPAKK